MGMATGFGSPDLAGNFYGLTSSSSSCGSCEWSYPRIFCWNGRHIIVVTLGGAGILYGIGAWWSDNLVINFTRPHDAEWLGMGSFWPAKYYLVFILIAIAAEIVLRHTNFGRKSLFSWC